MNHLIAQMLPGSQLELRRPPLPRIRIVPHHGWMRIGFAELWTYRELIYFLTVRDIKIRYKQTAIGVAWALIQPLFTMLIFSLFFGRLGKMRSEGIPYSLFTLSALIPWTFFATGLTQSSNSLVGNSNLITKVYFPRLIIPLSSVLAALLDLVIGFALLLLLMLTMGFIPNWRLVWSAPFLRLALLSCLGTGLWLAALNVEFRDVRYVVPFLSQFWMFATPIAYSGKMLSGPWRAVYALNPMVGVVEGFRWAVLGRGSPPDVISGLSSAVAVMLLISGLYYFRRMESSFSDVV
jgi:lipopolysaccharide transport system permease protein